MAKLKDKSVTTVEIEGHKVQLTNIEKPMWPKEGFTKTDVFRYYIAMWPWMRPHVANRPLSLVRYPHGIEDEHFYHKDFPDAPEWVERVPIQGSDRTVTYVMANNLATVIWAMNLGCVEIHPWLSTARGLDNPTHVMVDLDPMEPAGFEEAREIAMTVKVLLDRLGLVGYPKTSGNTGIHICVPIRYGYTFDETSAFVGNLGAAIVGAFPKLATNERKVDKRGGRVYIDHLQNRRGATMASVYSLRPSPGAPVSMPVTWDELRTVDPRAFSITNALDRLNKVGDMYAPLLKPEAGQVLPGELLGGR